MHLGLIVTRRRFMGGGRVAQDTDNLVFRQDLAIIERQKQRFTDG